MRTAATLGGGDPEAKALLMRGIADPGQRARAVQSLETSPANADLRRDPILYAFFLIQLDQRATALEKLGETTADGNSTIPQMLWGPAFDPIRNDPRFKAVLKMIGLPYVPEKIQTGVKS
jgi:hypothetical protein